MLLTGDLLQRMIQQELIMWHPLSSEASCPVQQYADDTLIIFEPSVEADCRVKLTLDQFAQANRLMMVSRAARRKLNLKHVYFGPFWTGRRQEILASIHLGWA
jgi:hypothetical protein